MSGLDKLRGFVKYEDIVRNGRIRHPDEIDNSCPQCSRNLDEWNLCHTCGECYGVCE